MTIKDFVNIARRTRRAKGEATSEIVIETEPPTGPLDAEPESAETLESYLAEAAAKRAIRSQRAIALHTVRRSETLESIATVYFGDAEYANEIADANLIDLDSASLKVGDILTIPN